jgi:hypothetical protein
MIFLDASHGRYLDESTADQLDQSAAYERSRGDTETADGLARLAAVKRADERN